MGLGEEVKEEVVRLSSTSSGLSSMSSSTSSLRSVNSVETLQVVATTTIGATQGIGKLANSLIDAEEGQVEDAEEGEDDAEIYEDDIDNYQDTPHYESQDPQHATVSSSDRSQKEATAAVHVHGNRWQNPTARAMPVQKRDELADRERRNLIREKRKWLEDFGVTGAICLLGRCAYVTPPLRVQMSCSDLGGCL